MSPQNDSMVVNETLMDGATIAIRRLSTKDADAVVRLYGDLDDDESYFRFFTLHPAHLDMWARSLTDRTDAQYAVGGFENGKLIGTANYVRCKTPGHAEVAVVVAHSEHLRGVGTALLRRLGQVARRNGVHRLVADVLAENHPMLRVIDDSGWPCTRSVDGAVLHLEIDLDSIPSDQQ